MPTKTFAHFPRMWYTKRVSIFTGVYWFRRGHRKNVKRAAALRLRQQAGLKNELTILTNWLSPPNGDRRPQATCSLGTRRQKCKDRTGVSFAAGRTDEATEPVTLSVGGTAEGM